MADLTGASAHRVHSFSLVTRDRPGVLVRIAMVFARRSYNIESLAVSPGAVEGFARFTITSSGDPKGADQICKHLAKLIDVVFVADHRTTPPIEIEIALIKLRCTAAERELVMRAATVRGARVMDESDGTIVLCATGTSREMNEWIAGIEPRLVEELVRSGRILMDRGASQFAHLLRAEG